MISAKRRLDPCWPSVDSDSSYSSSSGCLPTSSQEPFWRVPDVEWRRNVKPPVSSIGNKNQIRNRSNSLQNVGEYAAILKPKRVCTVVAGGVGGGGGGGGFGGANANSTASLASCCANADYSCDDGEDDTEFTDDYTDSTDSRSYDDISGRLARHQPMPPPPSPAPSIPRTNPFTSLNRHCTPERRTGFANIRRLTERQVTMGSSTITGSSSGSGSYTSSSGAGGFGGFGGNATASTSSSSTDARTETAASSAQHFTHRRYEDEDRPDFRARRRIIAGLKSFGIKGELLISLLLHRRLLTITVDEARNLVAPSFSGCCSTYVRISLMPDQERRTQCKTDLVSYSNRPIFNQTFTIELLREDYDKRLVISVWHRESCNEKSILLGCMAFSVKHIVQNKKVIEGWYFLLGPKLGCRKHLAVHKIHMLTYYGPIDNGQESDDENSYLSSRNVIL